MNDVIDFDIIIWSLKLVYWKWIKKMKEDVKPDVRTAAVQKAGRREDVG